MSSAGSLEAWTFTGTFARNEGYSKWLSGSKRVGFEIFRDGRPRRFFAPKKYEVREAEDPELSYIVVPNFLSAAEIEAIHEAGTKPSAVKCEDRDDNLGFEHIAHRFEGELRSLNRDLYRKALGVMVWADQDRAQLINQ